MNKLAYRLISVVISLSLTLGFFFSAGAMSAAGNMPLPSTIEATPATIKAILAAANPGDVIQLHAGTYPPLVLERSGYSVTNYPNEAPVISGSGSSINIALKYTGTDISVRGNIEIKNSSWAGVQIGGTGNTLDGSTVDNTVSHGIIAIGKNVSILNNRVYQSVTEGIDRNAQGWGSCIKVENGADGVLIAGNTVESTCYGEAYAVTMGKNVVIKNNMAKDIYRLGYYVDNSSNVLIDKNMAWCTTNRTYTAFAGSVEPYPMYTWTNVFKDITFSNNISNGCGGIHYWKTSTKFPASNLKIINNSIANNPSGTGIYIENIAGQSIIIQNNVSSYDTAASAGTTQSNNFAPGPDTFVGGSVGDPNSMKLKSNIAGTDSGLRDDFGGNARTLPLSIGAWELDGQVATNTPVTPSSTSSVTATVTATNTPTPTATKAPTQIPPTLTFTPTPTATVVKTNTPTPTQLPATPTATATQAPTQVIPTFTFTPTASPMPTLPTASKTAEPTNTSQPTSVPPTPIAGGNSVDVRVSSGNDDVEENSSGRMNFNSTDLDLVYDRSAQVVGIRFTGLNVPMGATITNAYIQFKVDKTSSRTINLNINGEASANASAFAGAARNVSMRPRTANSVTWSPPAWSKAGQMGTAQQTPNLKSIVQEVVSQPNWNSGNSIVMIITGGRNGNRVARSFDGDSAGAPMLHVEFSMPIQAAALSLSTPTPTVTVTATVTPTVILATPTIMDTFTPEPTQIFPSPTPTTVVVEETIIPTDMPTSTPIPPSPTAEGILPTEETPTPVAP